MTTSSTAVRHRILLFFRASFAAIVAAGLAWPLHEGLAVLLTSLSLTEIARIDRAEKLIAGEVHQLSQNRPFTLAFRFIRPGQSIDAPACAGTLQTHSGGYLAYAVWRVPRAAPQAQPNPTTTSEGPPRPAAAPSPAGEAMMRACGEKRFIYNTSGLGAPFVSAPTIVASVDILLRDIERFIGNENPDDVANLRLCAGTRTLLGPEICGTTELLRQCLSGEPSCLRQEAIGIKGVIEWRRWAALLLGLIQYICLVIFLFIVLNVIGLWFTFVNRDPILVATGKGGIQPIDPFPQDPVARPPDTPVPSPAFRAAMDKYREAPIRSNLDQIYVHTFARESADIPETSDIHAFRQFLVERVSARLAQLEKLADSILKLAFAGTIVGIAQALFAARDLDTANPIERLSVKAEMFAGIGVAFGTTLFGLGLVLILDRALVWLRTAWEDDIARSFHLVLDFSKTEPAQRLAKVPARQWEPVIQPPPRPAGVGGVPILAGIVAIGLCFWLISILDLWAPILDAIRSLIRRAI
jgi:hypothetical protein